MSTVPERVRWAVEVVDPGPADQVLELGFGPGVAAALVCERLTTGHLLAIDRSPVAVARTAARNADHVAAGRPTVLKSTVEDLDASEVDKAFSVNVNVFWTKQLDRELAALRRALSPGAELFVLYGTGPAGSRSVTPVIAEALADNGFVEVRTLESPASSGVRRVHSG
jgi:trans-aconitate methyltransferase